MVAVLLSLAVVLLIAAGALIVRARRPHTPYRSAFRPAGRGAAAGTGGFVSFGDSGGASGSDGGGGGGGGGDGGGGGGGC